MPVLSLVRRTAAYAAIVGAVAATFWVYAITPHPSSAPPESADGLLDRADTLAWGHRWADATPLYAKAQQLFLDQHRPSKALYVAVSQIPADESVSLQNKILLIRDDLKRPEAQDAETRIRILTVLGMTETNYDASNARATWEEVRSLALRLHHPELASRADGEQGIANFILGDTATAKKQVIRAWVSPHSRTIRRRKCVMPACTEPAPLKEVTISRHEAAR